MGPARRGARAAGHPRGRTPAPEGTEAAQPFRPGRLRRGRGPRRVGRERLRLARRGHPRRARAGRRDDPARGRRGRALDVRGRHDPRPRPDSTTAGDGTLHAGGLRRGRRRHRHAGDPGPPRRPRPRPGRPREPRPRRRGPARRLRRRRPHRDRRRGLLGRPAHRGRLLDDRRGHGRPGPLRRPRARLAGPTSRGLPRPAGDEPLRPDPEHRAGCSVPGRCGSAGGVHGPGHECAGPVLRSPPARGESPRNGYRRRHRAGSS